SGGAVSGRIARRRRWDDVSAEPALQPEHRRQHDPLLPRVQGRTGVPRGYRQSQDDLSVRQALPRAAPRTIRQLEPSSPDRSSRLLRIRSRHRLPRGLWLAARKARSAARNTRAERFRRELPDGQPRALLQGFVPAPVLAFTPRLNSCDLRLLWGRPR